MSNTITIPDTCYDIDMDQEACDIVDDVVDALRDVFEDEMDADDICYMAEEVADALISGRLHVVRAIYRQYGV